jgi:hypothetical protein
VYASTLNSGLVFGSTFGGETVYASTFNGQSGLLSSIGVGILAPELPLDVQGGGIIRGPLYISSFGALSSQTGNVIVSGDVFANGFFYPSDPLLKRDIRPYISHGLPEPVETYSSSEHLYEMLNIPAGSQGSLKKVRAPQEKKASVEKATSGKASSDKAPTKSAEPRVKRERTRTKRIAD